MAEHRPNPSDAAIIGFGCFPLSLPAALASPNLPPLTPVAIFFELRLLSTDMNTLAS